MIVPVALGGRSYDVTIEPALFDRAGELLAPYTRGGRLVVVTDETVWSAQGGRLRLGGIEAVPVIVPEGEAAKSWDSLAVLIDRLVALGIERSDHVAALGGGAVGDVAGFAAAILKRGCGVVQLPTTLLAQVDSSVGGKTGINLAAGKNLAGAFHQPSAVLIDPLCLDTLPHRQLRAGYAEVVKYGLIDDAPFFAWCEAEGTALLSGDVAARIHAISTSVAAKAAIVAEDEREIRGRRALLNLGHSFGHALEAETGFSDRLLHGEAVAVGMVLAFRLSAELGLCPREDADRAARHLATVGLPVSLAAAGIGDGTRLAGRMANDKKMRGGRLPLVLTRGIGKAFVTDEVDFSRIRSFLAGQK